MTEAEWLAAADPRPLLELLRGRVSRRKAGLWAGACYRANLPASAGLLEAVEVVERYADGGEAELSPHGQPRDIFLALIQPPLDPCEFALFVAGDFGTSLHGPAAGLLRDVVGNPFRPAGVETAWQAWNGGIVGRLAEAAYQGRELPSGHLDAGRLQVLADALEDAGCADAGILGHLRSAGPHVRGCWVVDLLTRRA